MGGRCMTSHAIEGACNFAWRTHKMMIDVPLFIGTSRVLAMSVTRRIASTGQLHLKKLDELNVVKKRGLLSSILQVSLDKGRFSFARVVSSFNFQAIARLHTNPGEYRHY